MAAAAGRGSDGDPAVSHVDLMDQRGPVGNIARALRQSQRVQASLVSGQMPPDSSATADAHSDEAHNDNRENASTCRLKSMLADYAARGKMYEEDAMSGAKKEPASRASVPVPPSSPTKREGFARVARSQFSSGETAAECTERRSGPMVNMKSYNSARWTDDDMSASNTERWMDDAEEDADRNSLASQPGTSTSDAPAAVSATSAPTGPPPAWVRDPRRSRFAKLTRPTDAVEQRASHGNASEKQPQVAKDHFVTAEEGGRAHVNGRNAVPKELFSAVQRVPKDQINSGGDIPYPTEEQRCMLSKEQFKTAPQPPPRMRLPKDQFNSGGDIPYPTEEQRRMLSKAQFKTAPQPPPRVRLSKDQFNSGGDIPYPTEEQRRMLSKEQFKTAPQPPPRARLPKEAFKTAEQAERVPKSMFHSADPRPPRMPPPEHRPRVPREQFYTAEVGTAARLPRDMLASAEPASPVSSEKHHPGDKRGRISREVFSPCETAGDEGVDRLTPESRRVLAFAMVPEDAEAAHESLVLSELEAEVMTAARLSRDMSSSADPMSPVSSEKHYAAGKPSRMSREIFSTCETAGDEGVDRLTPESRRVLAFAMVPEDSQAADESLVLCELEAQFFRQSFDRPKTQRAADTTGAGPKLAVEKEEEKQQEGANFSRRALAPAQPAAHPTTAVPPQTQGPARRGRMLPFAALPATRNGGRAAVMSANFVFEVARTVLEAED